MNEEFDKLMEAVAELQGKANGNATILEAMLMAHPDPERLRDCWYRWTSGQAAWGASCRSSLAAGGPKTSGRSRWRDTPVAASMARTWRGGTGRLPLTH